MSCPAWMSERLTDGFADRARRREDRQVDRLVEAAEVARAPRPDRAPRTRLREKNLHDTGRGALDKPPFTDPDQADYRGARTIDGTYNDLDDPLMGSIGSRFGRNVPLEHTWPDELPRLLEPNPRLISRELLTRETLRAGDDAESARGGVDPVRGPRLVQPRRQRPENAWEIPLEDDDPWPRASDAGRPDAPGPELRARQASDVRDRRHALVGRVAGLRQHPGSSRPRSGRTSSASCRSTPIGLPPQELDAHIDFKGVAGNFWVGLALLHSLFMREHNAVCDRLHAEYPELSDQQLYEKARLVVAALMAKIHTVDWTPAIIAHPTTVLGMRANWYGLLGERFDRHVRAADEERGDPRHPRLADEPPRRPLLAHGGVRGGLPDAPADPGRVRVPLPRGRLGAPGARAAGAGGARGAKPARRDVDGRPALLVRPHASGRDHPAQLPAVPPGLPPARRRPHRPRRDRHPEAARAGSAALQRLPAALPPRSPPPRSTR